MAYKGISGVPTAEIVAKFADGKLWVEQDRPVQWGYKTSGIGVPVQIGYLDHIDRVVSVDAYISGFASGAFGGGNRLLAPLQEAKVSGNIVFVVLRRTDLPQFLSGFLSGATNLFAYGALAGITSGLGQGEELASGLAAISGYVHVRVGVIGY